MITRRISLSRLSSIRISGIASRSTLTGRWSYLDYDEEPLQIASSEFGFADWDEHGGRLSANVALRTRTTISSERWFMGEGL